MQTISKEKSTVKVNVELVKLGLLWATIIGIFTLVEMFESKIYWVFDSVPFLHLHSLLEFITIIIYFVLFTVTIIPTLKHIGQDYWYFP
ncbi:membrane protein YdbS with pleckstrin-like domain [Alkaliphilus hydrothermalis]|uniref:Membrane protein YdbS with pleckstrin-like domain n=1 Tax=Alkaliphilus hydrothermalis TaxID=1482730 RepID=A0ABS2NM20_9FIRM|nr:membrane protein YdbS with pleckstrin-like domain [Alkaliphilus hydrothermalis]